MQLVLRLTRLPVSSDIPKSFCSYFHGRCQFQQQRRGVSNFAPLWCQIKPQVSKPNRSPRESSHSNVSHSNTASNGAPLETFSTKPPPIDSGKKKTNTKLEQDTDKNASEQSEPHLFPPSCPQKPKLSREAVRQNVRGYVFTRYFDYVKNYDTVLEKNFPGAVKLYRVFFDGVRLFFADMKRYVKVWRIANSSPDGLRALNRKELELFMQMPRDMVRVAPALIGTSLPMIGYAFFPLVFMYPRRFLTSHFWTLQQRSEFQQLQLQERFSHNRIVFRCLQAKLKGIKKHEKHTELTNLLGLVGSGFHPSVETILDVKEVFGSSPYSLESLSGKHIKHLNDMHGLPGGFSKRLRLREHAYLVHHMDLAIGREGGAHNMPLDAIQKSCSIRGLNPSNMSKDDMVTWLRQWISISSSVTEDHISLFLHLPIFLAYNHPNNWKLIYNSSQTRDSSAKPPQQ